MSKYKIDHRLRHADSLKPVILNTKCSKISLYVQCIIFHLLKCIYNHYLCMRFCIVMRFEWFENNMGKVFKVENFKAYTLFGH